MDNGLPSASLDKVVGSRVLIKTKLYNFHIYCSTVRQYSETYFNIRQSFYDNATTQEAKDNALIGKIGYLTLSKHEDVSKIARSLCSNIYLFNFIRMNWTVIRAMLFVKVISHNDVAAMFGAVLSLNRLPDLNVANDNGINILPSNKNAVSDIDWGNAISVLCSSYGLTVDEILDMPMSRFAVLSSRLSILPRSMM